MLFLIVDDLRPELGAYGRKMMVTPSMDKLAAEGVLFERAYSNVPVCGASRSSLMTGIRPTRERFVDFRARADEDAPGQVTLPGHFKKHGYKTLSLGKVFHARQDTQESWSQKPWHPSNVAKLKESGSYTGHRNYVLAENIDAYRTKTGKRGPPFEAADVADEAYFDGQIAQRAVKTLRQLKRNREQQGQPFFLAVGFLKPHLPFNAPKRYWDLYPDNSISLADNPLLPAAAPKAAWHNWGELRNHDGIPEAPEPVSSDMARKLIHGYYASVSYTDAQVGKVMAALKALDLAENTIVVLIGDHGWSLGEHGLWAKHSPFNVAVQAPLIVKLPGTSEGGTARGLVEFVDIYPSLVELAGLPRPTSLQGKSFVPLLHNPFAPGKSAVFPRWQKAESIRTDRYLYTAWLNKRGRVYARMLYDLERDPHETVNLAEQESHRKIVNRLHRRLLKNIADR